MIDHGSAVYYLSKNIREKLEASPILMDSIQGVYDEPIEFTQLPIVTLGEVTTAKWNSKTSYGQEITYTIHVFSKHRGMKEVNQITNFVMQILTDPDYDLGDDFSMELVDLELEEYIREPDGYSRHGILRLRYFISQEGER